MSENVQQYRVDDGRRRKLPKVRRSVTHSFRVGELEVYMQCGEYEDGSLGEIFLSASKEGTILAAFMDGFSIAISMGLQWGVPLAALCAKFIDWKFEPNGNTDDPEIQEVRSVFDYIFRRLALDYLTETEQASVGALDAGPNDG